MMKDKDGKSTLLEHAFEPQHSDENVQVLNIPEPYLKNFRSQKLIVVIREKGMFGAKDAHTTEVPLTNLATRNETGKTIKFDKVQFNVIVKVRQAANMKEFVTEEVEKVQLGKIHQTFTEYQSA